MSQHNLTNDVLTVRVINATAAGTTNVNSSSVDGLGYDNVRFVVCIGALVATQVTSLKVQESADNSVWSDATGAATANMADADSNKMLIVDVFKPANRYLRCVVLRGTANATIDSGVAELALSRGKPVTADTSVSAQKIVDYV